MLRIFLQDVNSGEPAAYCGSKLHEAMEAVKNYVEEPIRAMLASDTEGLVELHLSAQDMTDDEIEALPDM